MARDYSGILNNIKRYVPLDKSDEIDFTSIVTTQKVKKRQFIVQPQFVCKYQTYVVEGALRSYYVGNDGIDHTLQFAIEDWFISDFNSYINQTPATIFVEALEDSTIQQIAYKQVEALCSKNPKFERYFRMVAQKAFAYAQLRILSKLDKTAE